MTIHLFCIAPSSARSPSPPPFFFLSFFFFFPFPPTPAPNPTVSPPHPSSSNCVTWPEVSSIQVYFCGLHLTLFLFLSFTTSFFPKPFSFPSFCTIDLLLLCSKVSLSSFSFVCSPLCNIPVNCFVMQPTQKLSVPPPPPRTEYSFA